MKRALIFFFVGLAAASPCLAIGEALAAEPIPSKLVEVIESTIEAEEDRLIAIFKDLHENPELGFMEERTSGIVAKEPSTSTS